MISKTLIISGILCALAASLSAQDAKKEIRIDRADMKVEQQFTPQINAVNVVEKRWTPKVWLEAQVDFKVSIARTLGGREGTYPAIEIKYFIGLSGVKSKDGKPVALTGTINYRDVPNGDAHALAYVMPATLKRFLLKENGSKGDVAAFGMEIRAGGEALIFKSSTGARWWEPADKFSMEDAILPKDKTPFAPFWGDFDLATVSK